MLLALLLFSASVAVADPISDGTKQFRSGRYLQALQSFQLATKNRQVASRASLRVAAVLMRLGRYREVTRALRLAQKDRHTSVAARLMLARLNLTLGRGAAAIRDLQALVKVDASNHEARVLLGLALYDAGKHQAGYAMLDKMADFYNDGKIKSAKDFTLLGIALHRNEFFRNANEVFGDAIKADPNYLPANVHWGRLFLDKYNYNDADKSFRDVLKIDPNHPAALIGMAKVDLRSDHDRPGALKKIARVLKINPLYDEALLLKAEVYLDAERHADALKVLQPLLALNKSHLRALTLAGTVYYLLDDTANYERVRRSVLSMNPKYADFYHVVSEFGVKAHRYVDAIKLNLQALKVNPKFWKSYVSLGINYSRVGEDLKAKTYLEKAHEEDPYNVRAYNMSAILFDDVFKRYEIIKSKNLTFRFQKQQTRVLRRYVLPLMERAYRTFNKKYRFVAKQPLQIEIFKNPRDFAIRSIGLPRVGVHGICFGHVITSRSPSDGNFNWAQVLWHELAHVYHIQMSDSRVPRWFTEGLAVYEAKVARPEWRREMDLVLYEQFRQGRVVGINSFNLEFTHAKTFKQILAAYYQSHVVMEFIDKTWGFDKIRRMLLLYGKRKRTPEIFKRVLGVDIADFDQRFVQFLKGRFAPLKGYFLADLDFYRDTPRYLAAVKRTPNSAQAHAELAVSYLKSGRRKLATTHLERALKLDAKNALANYLAATRLMAKGSNAEAKRHLELMLRTKNDGYYVRLMLAAIARHEKATDKAIAHLKRATQIVPEYPDAYRTLARIYLKRKNDAEAYAVLKKLAMIDQNRAGVLLKLIDHDAKRKRWADVKTWSEMGLRIAPFYYRFHHEIGRALLELGQSAQALPELALAAELLEQDLKKATPGAPLKSKAAAVYRLLERAYRSAGQSTKAAEAGARAKELDPTHSGKTTP